MGCHWPLVAFVSLGFFEKQPGHLHTGKQGPPVPSVFLHLDQCLFVYVKKTESVPVSLLTSI